MTKAAVEPVWYLPGIAERFGVKEDALRRTLFEQTGGMYPELVTRPDLAVFLPPIGGITLYIFGDPSAVWDKRRTLACRVHDECNGSDVFGSDICTCRPYLIHGIEECIKEAQNGGAGLIVYNRKEGRALGEVTKFLVYNARKRQEGGDQAATYFERTECVAGVQDARFQQLMPDVLHWLGITRIDRFVSMSNMKHDALTGSGIEIGERVPIPDELIPDDAKVEMEAKKAAGYFTPKAADRRRAEGDGRAQDRGILVGRRRSRAFAAVGAAVRERAHEMLSAGLRGELEHFTVDLESLAQRRAGRVRADPRQLSGRQRAVPCALAAFRARRARPVGRARRAGCMDVAGREGARGVRSRDHLGAARRRRGAVVEISRSRDRAGRHALRRARRRQPAHVRGGRVLGRSGRSAARRRRAADAAQARRRRARLPEHGRQPPRRRRRPRRAAGEPRRGGCGEAATVRARGSRAAGRPLRSSRGAGRGRPPAGAAHPRSAARSISARSGRAG